MGKIIDMFMEKDLIVVGALFLIVVLVLILLVVLLCGDKKKKTVIDKYLPDPEEDLEEELEMERATSLSTPKEQVIETIKEEKTEPILNAQTESVKDANPTVETFENIEKVEEPQENFSFEIDTHYEQEQEKKLENTATNIEALLAQMQASLAHQEKDEIQKFEDEQEEKAIISYQELVKACRREEPVQVVKAKEETPVEPKENLVPESPIRKFKTSDFISPIYGKQKNDAVYKSVVRKENNPYIPKEEMRKSVLETEFSVEELQKEMTENENYLEELKKFRNSL